MAASVVSTMRMEFQNPIGDSKVLPVGSCFIINEDDLKPLGENHGNFYTLAAGKVETQAGMRNIGEIAVELLLTFDADFVLHQGRPRSFDVQEG